MQSAKCHGVPKAFEIEKEIIAEVDYDARRFRRLTLLGLMGLSRHSVLTLPARRMRPWLWHVELSLRRSEALQDWAGLQLAGEVNSKA